MHSPTPFHPDIVTLNGSTTPRATRRRRRQDETECPILDPLRHLAYNYAPIAHEETKRRKLAENGPRDTTGKTEKQLKNIESSEIGRESAKAYVELLEKQLQYTKAINMEFLEEKKKWEDKGLEMKQEIAQKEAENTPAFLQRLQACAGVMSYPTSHVPNSQVQLANWVSAGSDIEANPNMGTDVYYSNIVRVPEDLMGQENRGMGAHSFVSAVTGYYDGEKSDEPGNTGGRPTTWHAESSQDLTEEIRMVSLQSGSEARIEDVVNECRSVCSDLTALSNLRRA